MKSQSESMGWQELVLKLILAPFVVVLVITAMVSAWVTRFAGWLMRTGLHLPHDVLREALQSVVMDHEWPMNFEKHLKSEDDTVQWAAINKILTNSFSSINLTFALQMIRGEFKENYSTMHFRHGRKFADAYHHAYLASPCGRRRDELLGYMEVLLRNQSCFTPPQWILYANEIIVAYEKSVRGLRVGTQPVDETIVYLRFLMKTLFNAHSEFKTMYQSKIEEQVKLIMPCAYLLSREQWNEMEGFVSVLNDAHAYQKWVAQGRIDQERRSSGTTYILK